MFGATGHVTNVADAPVQAAIDAYLISGIGIAFEPGQAFVHQGGPERPCGIVQARAAAEVQHAQLLDTRTALLPDQLAATLHIEPHLHLEFGARHGCTEPYGQDCQ
ncbi:hypothetical protein D3C84_663880 [compost metagenome]